jgi:hypothetical protein
MTGNIYFSKIISVKWVFLIENYQVFFFKNIYIIITIFKQLEKNQGRNTMGWTIMAKSSTYCQEHNWWTWSNLAHIARNTKGEHDKI